MPAMGVSAAVTLIIGAALPGAAAAQAAGVNFELRGRAQYDSNVARASRSAAVAGNVKPGDIRYTVSGAVDATRNFGRQRGFLQGSVSYDFYQKNKSLERWRADIRSGLNGRLGPCSAGVTAAYSRTLSELSPISLSDPRDSTENTFVYGATSGCPLFGPIGINTSVQQRRVRTDGSRIQVGSDTTTVSSAIGYGSATIGTVSLIGSYATTDYKAPPQPVSFAPRSFDTYSVGLGYSRPIGTRFTGSANVSYFELQRGGSDPNQALTGGDTNGVSWNVALGYEASSRLGMNLAYSDGTTATTRIGSAYQREKRINLGARYQASSRLSGNASATYSERNFSGSVSGPLGVASKEERQVYNIGVSYALGRNITVSADGGISKVQTDQSLLNYTSERASVTVVARF